MVANLYIIAESFQNNTTYSSIEIENKVKRLAEDVRKINFYRNDNKLFSNYSQIYPLIFHTTFTVEDFLCRPLEVKKLVDRDVVNALLNIFEKTDNTNISSKEVIETLLPWQEENICHGLIAFHKVEGIPNEVQVLYGIDGWFKFRRHFLLTNVPNILRIFLYTKETELL